MTIINYIFHVHNFPLQNIPEPVLAADADLPPEFLQQPLQEELPAEGVARGYESFSGKAPIVRRQPQFDGY